MYVFVIVLNLIYCEVHVVDNIRRGKINMQLLLMWSDIPVLVLMRNVNKFIEYNKFSGWEENIDVIEMLVSFHLYPVFLTILRGAP